MFQSLMNRVAVAATVLLLSACSSHTELSEVIPPTQSPLTQGEGMTEDSNNTSILDDYDANSDEGPSLDALSTADLYLWKVTFPFNSSGNLSGNSDASESKDIASWLSSNSNNDYFYTNNNNNKFYFIAPHNGATTGSSGNVRCELREREEKSSGGTIDAYWDGSTSSETHILRFTCKVVDLPSTDRLTFAQVHDKNSTLDDVVQIGIKPNPNDNNKLYVTLQGSVLTGSGENANYDYLFEYSLNTWLTMKIKVKNNKITVINKKNGSWTTVFDKSIKDKWSSEDLDEEYFKAGCYLQGYPSSGEGKVVFSNLDLITYD